MVKVSPSVDGEAARRCGEILKFVGIPAMCILYVIIVVACHPLRILVTALPHVLLRL